MGNWGSFFSLLIGVLAYLSLGIIKFSGVGGDQAMQMYDDFEGGSHPIVDCLGCCHI